MHFIKYNPESERLHANLERELETETELIKSENIDTMFQEAIINGYISAELLKEQLFPSTQAKVFISHSSADVAVALKLKEKLQEEGISAFVDSEVWENVYEILKRYQFPKGVTNIPADEGNDKSKQLFLMLAGALCKTIYQSACFVYVVPKTEELGDEKVLSTSPWLAHELGIAEMIYRMQQPQEKAAAMVNESIANMTLLHDVSAPFIEEMEISCDKVVNFVKKKVK